MTKRETLILCPEILNMLFDKPERYSNRPFKKALIKNQTLYIAHPENTAFSKIELNSKLKATLNGDIVPKDFILYLDEDMGINKKHPKEKIRFIINGDDKIPVEYQVRTRKIKEGATFRLLTEKEYQAKKLQTKESNKKNSRNSILKILSEPVDDYIEIHLTLKDKEAFNIWKEEISKGINTKIIKYPLNVFAVEQDIFYANNYDYIEEKRELISYNKKLKKVSPFNAEVILSEKNITNYFMNNSSKATMIIPRLKTKTDKNIPYIMVINQSFPYDISIFGTISSKIGIQEDDRWWII